MAAPEFVVYAKFVNLFSVATFGFESFKFLNIKFVCSHLERDSFSNLWDKRMNNSSYFVSLFDVVVIRIPYCRPVVTLIGYFVL